MHCVIIETFQIINMKVSLRGSVKNKGPGTRTLALESRLAQMLKPQTDFFALKKSLCSVPHV